MSNEIVGRFPSHRDGHSNRRDADANPKVIVVAIDTQAMRLNYHQAGDEFVRAIDLHHLKVADELIEGMAPHDAFLVGAWCEVAMQRRREARCETQ